MPASTRQSYLIMEQNQKYTVVIMGTSFVLTKSQIEFDSPNYFTTCFLGDFHEAQTHHLELSRDPDLFRVIIRYLCGYSVLPLTEKQIPSDMTLASALTNLRNDAAFYQLDGLLCACDESLSDQEPTLERQEKHLALLGVVSHSNNGIDTGAQLFLQGKDNFLHMEVAPNQLLCPPFTGLTDPASPRYFSEFRTLAAVQDILKLELGAGHHKKWRLVGYRANWAQHQSYELTILLERTSAITQKD
ncbi:hypothetical protein CTheo_8043 [Ceratobasidium theobromae]|uniref:BTB domain-containing protein n=1 Tax=Ceratobasidium theobromae TaxID=1582974 RepID=A0A5N5QAT0_9AGAM|nr:hypothetical protein CTheo_8043 [Ceratobasidium theobromae]